MLKCTGAERTLYLEEELETLPVRYDAGHGLRREEESCAYVNVRAFDAEPIPRPESAYLWLIDSPI